MSTPASYFERMYADSTDPWSFTTRWYEERKRDLTVAALPRPRYRSAFEPGCAIGLLTARLAKRCDRVLAVDAVDAAAAATRARLADRPHVLVERRSLPDQWPDGTFDLIVLSELGYYFDDADLDVLLKSTVDALEPGGTLLAVHWRPRVAEHTRDGDAVHAAIRALPGLARTVSHVEADVRLEVYQRVPPEPRSVAQAEGLR